MPVHPASIDWSIAAIALASPQAASFFSCAFVVLGVNVFLISFRWAVHRPHAFLKRSEDNSEGKTTATAQSRLGLVLLVFLIGIVLRSTSGELEFTT